jgi:hypothetical protein
LWKTPEETVLRGERRHPLTKKASRKIVIRLVISGLSSPGEGISEEAGVIMSHKISFAALFERVGGEALRRSLKAIINIPMINNQ